MVTLTDQLKVIMRKENILNLNNINKLNYKRAKFTINLFFFLYMNMTLNYFYVNIEM